jgi:hypothetical protein
MRSQICDDLNRKAVMLSGGWDSRGMLPLMKEAGGEFQLAKTWGHLDRVPESDVSLARQIAEQYDVPFRFVQYGTQSFVDNATEWCFVSELMNDNFGWYAEGPTTLGNDYDRTIGCLFVGDEIWGWGDDVATDDEIRAAVLPPHLPETVARVLKPTVVDECRALYDDTIRQIMSRCRDDRPNDRKDFLYLYGRVARFIFTVGYYKEHCTPLRRPFFGKRALDVIQGLPAKHRIYKTVYRSMLKRYAPCLTNFPVATANSLPDWDYDLRRQARLRTFFESLLESKRIAEGPYGAVLNTTSIARVARHEMSKNVKPIRRRRSRAVEMIGNTVRSNRVSRYLDRKLRPNVVRNTEAGQFSVLRRVALLSLFADRFGIHSATL